MPLFFVLSVGGFGGSSPSGIFRTLTIEKDLFCFGGELCPFMGQTMPERVRGFLCPFCACALVALYFVF